MKTQEATIKLPKLSARFAAVLAVGAATIITGVSSLAWGPERPVLEGNTPAD